MATATAVINNYPQFLGVSKTGEIKAGVKEPDTYIRGSACHQQYNGQTPACVVTDLTGKILLSNTGGKDQWKITKAFANITRFWTASTAYFQCSIEKLDFNTSHPTLTPADSTTVHRWYKTNEVGNPIPNVPATGTSQTLIGGSNPDYPLYLNDEICIYMGYIDGIRTITADDLINNRLLRVFVGVVDIMSGSGSDRAGDTILVQCRDRMKYLMDSLATYNTADFSQSSLSPSKAYELDDQGEGGGPVKRKEVILGLAKRSIGHLEGSKSLMTNGVQDGAYNACKAVCGFEFKFGFVTDLEDFKDPAKANTSAEDIGQEFYSMYKPGNIAYIGGAVTNQIPWTLTDSAGARTRVSNTPSSALDLTLGGTSTSVRTSAISTPDSTVTTPVVVVEGVPTQVPGVTVKVDENGKQVSSNPTGATLVTTSESTPSYKPLIFNIYTCRQAYATGSGSGANAFSSNFQVTDRVPIEYIKYLALQEPWPMEVFQDHRNGEFWFAPRGLDYSGFADRKRLYRTYFYKRTYANPQANPEGATSTGIGQSPDKDPRTHQAQMCKTFREEISTINWRSNIIATSGPEGGGSSIASNSIHLAVVPSWLKNRKYACTYYYVNDPTAGTVTGELALTALQFARNMGREVKVASMTILGDPSLSPGEAVTVIGSVLSTGKGQYGNDPFDMVDLGLGEKSRWQAEQEIVDRYHTDLINFGVEAQNIIKGGTQVGSSTTVPNSTAGTNISTSTQNSVTMKNSPSILGPITPDGKITDANARDEINFNVKPSASAAKDACIANFTKGDASAKGTNKNAFTPPDDLKVTWRVEAVKHKFNVDDVGYYTEASLFPAIT